MGQSREFIYKTYIKWSGAKRGILYSSEKPNIEIATPPEFKGHAGIWTPEELFIASVNSCIMTTFLYYVGREGVELLGYESEVIGVLEKVDGKFIFSEIKVSPKIKIKSIDQIEKAKALISVSEKNCIISNSINCKVTVLPEVGT